jgi:hypothetical protein
MELVPPRARLHFATALAAGSAAALVAARPPLSAAMWSRGEDLAIGVAWAIALAAATWLLVVSAACSIAIGARRPSLARTFAFALPPALRRSVEIALVASCLAVSAAPAHAANKSPAPVIDQPVVRASRSLELSPVSPHVTARTPTSARHAAPTTALSPRLAPTTTSSPPSVPQSAPPGRASQPTRRNGTPAAPRSATRVGSQRHVVVRPGDNLWAIARAELDRAAGAPTDDGQVARYWRAVIEANRSTLRSGNPSLIFPGEIVALPPPPPVS